jgi:hypothetical protein
MRLAVVFAILASNMALQGIAQSDTSVVEVDSSLTVLPQPVDSAVGRPRQQEERDPARSIPKKNAPHGKLLLGMVQGQQPYTDPQAGSLNATVQGNARLRLLGVPIKAELEGNTASPLRGWPVRLNVALDRDALSRSERLDETRALDAVRRSMDSLQTRIHELERPSPPTGLQDSVALQGSVPPSPPRTNLPDTLASAQPAELPDTSFVVGALPTAPPIDVPMDAGSELGMATAQLDSLKKVERRLTALVNARKGTPQGLGGLLADLRSIEIGECHLNSSDFLVSDLVLQGVHAEVLRGDLYLDAAFGRSFDDSWRALQANPSLADQLHQAALFLPARDLNPRKLATAVVGHGAPEGDHLHLGVLYGTKYLAPAGSPISEDQPLMRNLVVELNTGWAIGQHYQVNWAVARSAEEVRQAGAASEVPNTAAQQRTSFMDPMAHRLGVRAQFASTGTTIELESRIVGKTFNSLGMGFLRRGITAWSLVVQQRLSQRCELRIRGSAESRADPLMTIRTEVHRGHLQLNYRPTRALTINASVQPAVARTILADGRTMEQRNVVAGMGMSYRRRIGYNNLTSSGRVDRYHIEANDSLAPTTYWFVGMCSMQWKSGAVISATWSGGLSGDSAMIGEQLGLNFSASVHERTRMSGHAALGLTSPLACNYGARVDHQLRGGFLLGGSMEYFGAGAIFFPTSLGIEQNDVYNWTINFGYQW